MSKPDRKSKQDSADAITTNPTVRATDVAVISGGVSGVYLAWKLATRWKQDKTNKTVEVFESDKRCGGRLLSLTPPGIERSKAEMGGMRFLTNQTRVCRLISELRLHTRLFESNIPQSIQHLRNKQFRYRHYSDQQSPGQIPYRLCDQERGLTPHDLLAHAIRSAVPDSHLFSTLGDWEKADWEGIPLYQLGFWNVLSQVLSSEGYELARDASGYDQPLSNWNASHAIPWFLTHFAPGIKQMYIDDGYEEIVVRMKERLERITGHPVKTNFRLTKIHHSRQDDFLLEFENQQIWKAKAVVFALPRRAIELILANSSLQIDKELLESVEPIPMFKIFFCYEHPWWHQLGLSSGQSVTTLPVRQCYYYSNAGPGSRGPSLMLASYSDGPNVDYWRALTVDDHRSGNFIKYNTNHQSSWYPHLLKLRNKGLKALTSIERSQWEELEASLRLVVTAHRQIHEMHGLRFTPMPYAAACKYWGDDPYGGGVNYWKAGCKPSVIKSKMIQPLRSRVAQETVPLFICGSAYSGHQGWVEGALETADEVLNTIS